MPDALDTLMSQVPDGTPQSFTEAAVMERWKDGFPENKENPETPSPEAKEPPKQEKKAEVTEAKKGDLPDSLLGIEPQKKDEEPDLISAEPSGPLKHENYKKLQAQAKAKIEAEQARYTSLQKELEEIKGKFTPDYVPDEIKTKLDTETKRRTELEERLGRIAVEHTDAFKERFTNKQNGIITSLKETGKDLGINADVIDQLLASSGKRRFDILEDVDANTTAKAYLTSLLKDHDQLQIEKSQYLDEWKVNSEKLTAKEQAEKDSELARMKDREDRAFEQATGKHRKTFALFQKIEGNEDWNAQVDAREAKAKELFNADWTPELVSEVVLAAVAAEPMYKAFETVRSQLIEARTELQKYKAAGPSAPPPGSKTPVQDDSKLTFEERAKRTFDSIVGSAANNGM